MAAIGWGELEVGVVYSPGELGHRYNVRPAQVRLSLESLARDGVVVSVPGGGYRLAEPTKAQLRDLVELRLLIEVPAAREVAESGLSDEDCSMVRELAEATMSASAQNDHLGYIRTDLDFHLQIIALSGSAELVEVVRLLRIRSCIKTVGPVAKSFMIQNAKEHCVMAQLLADGDGPGMDDIMRRHLSRVLDETR